MRPINVKLFLLLVFLACTLQSYGQTCNGSLGDPVINEDFGSGVNPGPPLAPGVTNMTYWGTGCPNDGLYTIANNSGDCFGNSWHILNQDHTGNPNGYMMIVNASLQPSIFFTQQTTVGQLCPNTTYEFAAWITNIMHTSACGGTSIQPNITFSIETTGGTVLQTYNTGDIPTTSNVQWTKYGTFFTTPSNSSQAIVVKMTNNAKGGCGNDFALDDITFRACGPIIQAGFGATNGPASQSLCQGGNAVYTLKTNVVGGNNPVYQWQSNLNGKGWNDMPGNTADSLNIPFNNAIAGVYQYRLGIANGSNISSVLCRVYSPSLTINVNPLPAVPSISAKAVCACPGLKLNEFCFGDSVRFNDITSPADTSVKTWLWNFGDNTTSNLPTPAHLYAKPGNYNVTLTVANSYGCTSDSIKTISINNKPVAAFLTSAPDCAGQNVTFTDQSTITGGKIVQWVWSYGDGKSDTLTTGNPFNHVYANTGTDTVKLTVTTDSGCSSLTSTQVITVKPLPVVNFVLPAVCLNDTYAQFTDQSTIADGTMQGFTYLWNFGDPNASAANPNTSSLKNPTHKYTQASNYNVILTVTSVSGCIVSKTQAFTVNGDTPVAAFSVENSNNLCSSDPVVFDDQSTVNFGNITKIKWYFDYNNNPQDSVVYLPDSIPANRKFSHSYGLFNSPLTKSYTVRMDVYSGITCVNSTQQNITVNANPVVTVSSIGPLCQTDQPVQIVQNTNGFIGQGVFTGTGVSSTGLFDSSVSGTGTFTINYLFADQNGCTYSTNQQVIVNPVPALTLIPDIVVLVGGQITLPAKVTTDSLTYQWTPSTGLDHDNILNPIARPNDNTIYKLVVTNAMGCSVAAQISVTVLKYPVIPNAFTPNGDGINDAWNIQYLNEYPNCTVNIFNRYGEKVFSENGYGIAWDGKYHGSDLPQGTYYYIINPGSGRKAMSGSVTIIK